MDGVRELPPSPTRGTAAPRCRHCMSWVEAGLPTRKSSDHIRIRPQLNWLALPARLEALTPLAGNRIRLGVSPHAPYSVSGALYAGVAQLARERGYPIAVHIAESVAESDLLGSASGGFADAWRGRGIPLPTLPGRTPLAWLDQHGVLGPTTLCIHVVQASTKDLVLLARTWCGDSALSPLQCSPRSRGCSASLDARSRHQGRDWDRLRGQCRTLRPPCRGTSGVCAGGFAARGGSPALHVGGRPLPEPRKRNREFDARKVG